MTAEHQAASGTDTRKTQRLPVTKGTEGSAGIVGELIATACAAGYEVSFAIGSERGPGGWTVSARHPHMGRRRARFICPTLAQAAEYTLEELVAAWGVPPATGLSGTVAQPRTSGGDRG